MLEVENCNISIHLHREKQSKLSEKGSNEVWRWYPSHLGLSGLLCVKWRVEES
jgi:hypothetical protein